MMPPMVLKLQIAREGRRFRMWLPLFLFWLLILPFAVVTVPVVAIVFALLGRHPLRMLWALWSFVCAVPGSCIEVKGRRGLVFLHVT